MSLSITILFDYIQLNFYSSSSTFMNDNNQSIIDDDISENNFSKNDDLIEKCPICFMIFPSNMITYNRHLHVNDHYNDD